MATTSWTAIKLGLRIKLMVPRSRRRIDFDWRFQSLIEIQTVKDVCISCALLSYQRTASQHTLFFTRSLVVYVRRFESRNGSLILDFVVFIIVVLAQEACAIVVISSQGLLRRLKPGSSKTQVRVVVVVMGCIQYVGHVPFFLLSESQSRKEFKTEKKTKNRGRGQTDAAVT